MGRPNATGRDFSLGLEAMYMHGKKEEKEIPVLRNRSL